MKKRLLIMLIILLIAIPFTAFSREAPTFHGSSGLIAVPSANVITAPSIVFGSWFLLQKDFGFLPRFLISFLNRWEIGATSDIQNPNGLSFVINTKYKFYDSGKIKAAFGGAFQHNSAENDSWSDGQVFLTLTWAGWANTSMFIGYTFGDFTNKSHIDFGIGVEKIFLSGGFGSLALIIDFANFDFRNHKGTIRGAGVDARGIFNLGVRVLLFKKLLNVDFVFVDLLDDDRQIALSLFFSITF